jgi:hypothetical protein
VVPERDVFLEQPVLHFALSSVRTESNETRVGVCLTTRYLDCISSSVMTIDE